ncbi:MAG: gluconate 2-dehydrogenase subunit 3 family protein [Chloroflexota bacterium]
MDHDSLFTDEQRALLKAALNRIIPADDRFPGAGDLGGADAIERSTGSSASRRRTLLDGLCQIDLTAWREDDRAFAALPAERQDHVLRLVERASPVFFDRLVALAYRAYYVNPEIVRLVGAPTRPPQPEGYALPPFDPARLENVRKRGPIYRRA